MITPLLTLVDKTSNEVDLQVTGDFDATEATVTAVTPKGKGLLGDMFGNGAVSFNLPKSKVQDFAVFAQRKGLVVV